MKNILLIAVILFSGLSLLAQETTIDKAEFDKVMGKSFQVLRNQPHRIIETSEDNSFDRLSKSKAVTERIGANWYLVFESEAPNLYSKTERISINGKNYTRKLNASWVEATQVSNYQPSTDWEILTDETTYKSLGEQSLDNKKVKVYQTTWYHVTVKKDNGFQADTKAVTTYYFNEAGLMIKSETNSETISKGKDKEGSGQVSKPIKGLTKRTQITEIDPNIKIEAPQVG